MQEAGSQPSSESIFRQPYALTTFGIIAMIVFNAFESMAVTTVMPVAAQDLGQTELFALAFAAPMAISVVGMVLAGSYSDRKGPVGAIFASVALFVAGLLIAGTAMTMPVLVIGRIIQGFAGGANAVALTVLVAKAYPNKLHAPMFAAFAAAWVIPSIVGPYVGGLVAEQFSWHWVFLGVLVLIIPALAGIIPALRKVSARQAENPEHFIGPYPWGRLFWSIIATLAVIGLNLGGQLPGYGVLIAVASMAVCLLALRPLLPTGTYRAAAGIPSIIAMRAMAAAAFFGAEVFLPRTLMEVYGLDASIAGLALTCSAVSWAIASAIQGKLGEERFPNQMALRIGAIMLFAVVTGLLLVIWLQGPVWSVILVWLLGGAGMGLMYPRMSVLVLALSRPGQQGFNSSALSISDSLGNALCVAVSGLVFIALVQAPVQAMGWFIMPVVCAIVMLVIAARKPAAVD